MADLIEKFLERVNRLEVRYKRDKYADAYMVPADECKAVRDTLAEHQKRIAELEGLARNMSESVDASA